MSAQAVGDKKLRQAREGTGLPLDRVLRIANDRWIGRFPTEDGHAHVAIDPRTWETEPDDVHWSSCAT